LLPPEILRLNCTKFAYSAPPNPLAGFRGLLLGEVRGEKEKRNVSLLRMPVFLQLAAALERDWPLCGFGARPRGEKECPFQGGGSVLHRDLRFTVVWICYCTARFKVDENVNF